MNRLLVLILLLVAGLAPVRLPAATVTVGVEAIEYLPYYQGRADGSYAGYGAEILRAWAEDRGHQIEFRPLPI